MLSSKPEEQAHGIRIRWKEKGGRAVFFIETRLYAVICCPCFNPSFRSSFRVMAWRGVGICLGPRGRGPSNKELHMARRNYSLTHSSDHAACFALVFRGCRIALPRLFYSGSMDRQPTPDTPTVMQCCRDTGDYGRQENIWLKVPAMKAVLLEKHHEY